jgi:DNA invertase Pin-like site-specific DNA recombinase
MKCKTYPGKRTVEASSGRVAVTESRAEKKCDWLGQRVGRMMPYTQAEKMEIIRLVETSEQPVKRTLNELGVPRSTFYDWYQRYSQAGYEGLANRSTRPHRVWNRIPGFCQAFCVNG